VRAKSAIDRLTTGNITWTRVGNPSNGSDEALGVAVEGIGVYIVGYDSRGGDARWRMEKRYP